MSITSEIERIKTNIANAYTELENKGATITGERNSDNLSAVIVEVPTGGGGGSIEDYFDLSKAKPGRSSMSCLNAIIKELPDITIYNTNTLQNFAGDYTFINSTALVKVGNIYAASQTGEAGWFNSCNGMFNTCHNLETVGEIDCQKCANFTNMFANCPKLTNFGGLKDAGKAFTQASANYSKYSISFYEFPLTHESLMNIINNLYDLKVAYSASGSTLYTQRLMLGSTNIAKLTSTEIAIATDKGWTVS